MALLLLFTHTITSTVVGISLTGCIQPTGWAEIYFVLKIRPQYGYSVKESCFERLDLQPFE
jgi:hypothetical protein